MNSSGTKHRGGRSSAKGRSSGVYGLYKGQEEEQQLLAAALDTSNDFTLVGQEDRAMKPPERLHQDGSSADFEQVHGLTTMLEGTDLYED
jgi:hypothetical protein